MILTFILTLILSHSALADCNQQKDEIISKTQYSQRMMGAIESLLVKNTHSPEPFAFIFPIDLNDVAIVKKLALEISTQLDPKQVEQTTEITPLLECAQNSKELEELVALKVKLNEKKLDFLNRPMQEQQDLAADYERRRQSADSKLLLDQQIASTKNAIVMAQTEIDSSKEMPEDLKIAKSLLNTISTDNEKTYLAFLDLIKEKNTQLKKVQDQAKLMNKLKGTEKKLEASSALWRVLVDELEGIFTQLNSTSFQQIPTSLQFPNYLSQVDSNETIKTYFKTLKKAQSRQSEISASITYHIEELKKDSFHTLNNIGGTRAELLQKCDENPTVCERKRGISEENINDFIRELKIIPLKIEAGYAAKWFEMKRKSKMGLDGWLDLSNQLMILFILLISPLIISRIFDWITEKTSEIRSDLFSKSAMDYHQRMNYAAWIEKVIPFITPGAMLIMTFFVTDLIKLTDFPELNTLVFYLQIYYSYRLTRLLFNILLEAVFTVDLNVKTSKGRVSILARRISRLIFIEIAVLHFIGDTARVALVYSLASDFIFLINIFFIFKKSYEWKKEITQSFSARLPKVWTLLSRWENKQWFNVLYPLMLVAGLIHEILNLTYSRLSQLDISKKLLSEILKKKLQNSEAAHRENTAPSPSYLKYFDYYLPAQDKIFIDREKSPIKDITDKISFWLNNKTHDDLTVIVGNRGMGKTTILSKIHSILKTENDTHLIKVPTKTLDKESFFSWFNELFGTQLNSTNDFLAWDNELTTKKIIFVDDIQNLFLAVIGGFEAYELFTEIIGLKTKNIFWCLTTNSQSWGYLKGIYGQEHFYGSIFPLTAWKDYEIQNLILTRHGQSSYQRIYDKTVKAFGGNENFTGQAEGQFFRLLWGQSRGNPRSALMYWLSAISEPRPDMIYIGVPSFVDSNLVGRMSDESHFLLAAIARHESLTYSELNMVTGVATTIIRKCLKEFEDKDLTWTDDEERIRISSKSQYVIDYFLMGKNFLYE